MDEKERLENFAFVVSPETVNKREENALLSFRPTPAKVHERGEILVLINWLSAFYIFATLGDWLCEPANMMSPDTKNASQPKLTNFISGSKFARKKLKKQIGAEIIWNSQQKWRNYQAENLS